MRKDCRSAVPPAVGQAGVSRPKSARLGYGLHHQWPWGRPGSHARRHHPNARHLAHGNRL